MLVTFFDFFLLRVKSTHPNKLTAYPEGYTLNFKESWGTSLIVPSYVVVVVMKK